MDLGLCAKCIVGVKCALKANKVVCNDFVKNFDTVDFCDRRLAVYVLVRRGRVVAGEWGGFAGGWVWERRETESSDTLAKTSKPGLPTHPPTFHRSTSSWPLCPLSPTSRR